MPWKRINGRLTKIANLEDLQQTGLALDIPPGTFTLPNFLFDSSDSETDTIRLTRQLSQPNYYRSSFGKTHRELPT